MFLEKRTKRAASFQSSINKDSNWTGEVFLTTLQQLGKSLENIISGHM